MRTALKIVFLTILLVHTLAFTPLENLQCDASISGTRNREYVSETVTNPQQQYTKVGEFYVVGNNGASFQCQGQIFYSGNTYVMKGYGPDLQVYTQTYTHPYRSQFLGVRDHLMVTKQYNQDESQFKIGAYYFQNGNVRLTNLGRITINNPTLPAGDPRQGLQFYSFIQYYNYELYLIFRSNTRTQIHKKNIGSSGDTNSWQLVAESKLDVKRGGADLLFDVTTRKFYDFTSAGNPYTVVNSRSTFAGSQFGTVLGENLRFHKHYEWSFSIISWTKEANNNIWSSFGWYGRQAVLAQDYDATGAMVPISFANRFNLVVLTANKFALYKLNSAGAFVSNGFSGLSGADLSQARNDFSGAVRVSFSIQKIFALNPDFISIYELSTGAGSTTVNKIGQISLSDSLADLLSADASITVKMQMACKCTDTKVSTFVCFTGTLKCMAAVSSQTQVCTTAYADAVPQFV